MSALGRAPDIGRGGRDLERRYRSIVPRSVFSAMRASPSGFGVDASPGMASLTVATVRAWRPRAANVDVEGREARSANSEGEYKRCCQSKTDSGRQTPMSRENRCATYKCASLVIVSRRRVSRSAAAAMCCTYCRRNVPSFQTCLVGRDERSGLDADDLM